MSRTGWLSRLKQSIFQFTQLSNFNILTDFQIISGDQNRAVNILALELYQSGMQLNANSIHLVQMGENCMSTALYNVMNFSKQ